MLFLSVSVKLLNCYLIQFFLKNNCLAVGTKSENINVHLAILIESDGIGMQKTYTRMLPLRSSIPTIKHGYLVVISYIMKFVFVNSIKNNIIKIKESSMKPTMFIF